MKNFRIFLLLANGEQMPLEFSSGKEVIEYLYGDDTGVPPLSLSIEADDEEGKTVSIGVPADQSDEVSVSFD